MSRYLKFYIVVLVITLMVALFPESAEAQCSMCRASVENSISNGGQNVGAGLNKGILYLMLAPYVLISTIAYIWFKKSGKYTKERKNLARNLQRL